MISARRFSTNPLSFRNGPDFPSLQRTRRRSITLHLRREWRFLPLRTFFEDYKKVSPPSEESPPSESRSFVSESGACEAGGYEQDEESQVVPERHQRPNGSLHSDAGSEEQEA